MALMFKIKAAEIRSASIKTQTFLSPSLSALSVSLQLSLSLSLSLSELRSVVP